MWDYGLVIRRFFLQLIWPILRSKESASNFVSFLKKAAAETHRMLQEAFGDNAMRQSKRFNDRRTSVEDDERSGRPSTSTTPENVSKVSKAILADRRQIIHNVCEVVVLSYGTVRHILADSLNMRRISASFVPRLLSNDQKAHCVCVCKEFKTSQRRPQLHRQYHNRWWNMDVLLWL